MDFAWIFFRANSVQDVGILLKKLFTTWNIAPTATFAAMDITLVGTLIVLFAILIMNQMDRAVNHYDVADGSAAISKRGTFIFLVWAVIFTWMILLQGGGGSTFIYFQF